MAHHAASTSVDFKNTHQAVCAAAALLEVHFQVSQRVAELRLDDILAGQPVAEPADPLDDLSQPLHHLA